MSSLPDKEFERLAVLHSMGALSDEEAERFQAERLARGASGERLVRGVERALQRGGPEASPRAGPDERAALAAVTSRPLPPDRGRVWLVAAVLLAAIGVGAVAWALYARHEGDRTAAALRAAEARADSLATVVAHRESALAARPRIDELAPLLAAPDLTVTLLAGSDPSVSGRLLASDARGALLVASGLPALPEERVYRLWRQGRTGTEAITDLGRAPDGHLFARFSSTDFLEGARALTIDAEDRAEGTTPGGPPVLQGWVGGR